MGGITTLLFSNYMKTTTVEQAAVISDETVEVIVARETFKKNERISMEKLEVKQVPKHSSHPQAITSLEELDGLFVNANIEKGEMFLSHRVQSEEDEGLFISRKVNDGHRAISISVNFVQSVSTLIEPEDYVDVIYSEEEENESESESPKVISKILLENVRVLAVGRKMLEPTSTEQYVEYSAVTLELLPADAVKLINGIENGSIHLMLNSRLVEEEIN